MGGCHLVSGGRISSHWVSEFVDFHGSPILMVVFLSDLDCDVILKECRSFCPVCDIEGDKFSHPLSFLRVCHHFTGTGLGWNVHDLIKELGA
eukprot:TRINITY_DN3951_c1_g1_i2.p1 TRINITY_DN3951_c1_g1~~TRINITY_DN3951_c1_g1_i2.p1  ORF type:complete len:100 (-),score=9.43 TRINITY_DN3951_c1_g1_i2:234-509(-)